MMALRSTPHLHHLCPACPPPPRSFGFRFRTITFSNDAPFLSYLDTMSQTGVCEGGGGGGAFLSYLDTMSHTGVWVCVWCVWGGIPVLPGHDELDRCVWGGWAGPSGGRRNYPAGGEVGVRPATIWYAAIWYGTL